MVADVGKGYLGSVRNPEFHIELIDSNQQTVYSAPHKAGTAARKFLETVIHIIFHQEDIELVRTELAG